MTRSEMNRRQFQQLTAAAMGGLMAGGLAGCNNSPEKPAATTAADAKGKHLCRGLNECKGQGKLGENDCRGQGTCATIVHEALENACKGQGGCGDNPGLNECKGKGACESPLMEHAWTKVRARLAAQWKKEDKPFGEAPKKATEPADAEDGASTAG